MTNYWKVKMSYDEDYKIGKEKGFAGICWSKLDEDLSWVIKTSEDFARRRVKEKLCKAYPHCGNRTVGKWAGEIVNFVKMKKNDIVLATDSSLKDIMIGKVSDKYKFDSKCIDGSNCLHKRPVEWIQQINCECISSPLAKALNQRGTVIRLDDYTEEICYLMQFGKRFELPTLEIKEIDKNKCNDIIKRIGSVEMLNEKHRCRPICLLAYRSARGIVNTQCLSHRCFYLGFLQSKRILYLDEFDFEEFVANILKLWWDVKTEVTGKRPDDGRLGDGGVDIQCAFFNPTKNGLKRYTFFADVQVKRMKNTIGLKDIKKFRDKVGDNRIGLFVTTSAFTKDVKRIAKSFKEKPIYLIDGKILVLLTWQYYEKLDDKFKNVLKIDK